MFNFTFMPDVGMDYVSLDPYTLFECFLAWPSLHPFTFLDMFLLSCLQGRIQPICLNPATWTDGSAKVHDPVSFTAIRFELTTAYTVDSCKHALGCSAV